jgi:hypothetical protein
LTAGTRICWHGGGRVFEDLLVAVYCWLVIDVCLAGPDAEVVQLRLACEAIGAAEAHPGPKAVTIVVGIAVAASSTCSSNMGQVKAMGRHTESGSLLVTGVCTFTRCWLVLQANLKAGMLCLTCQQKRPKWFVGVFWDTGPQLQVASTAG